MSRTTCTVCQHEARESIEDSILGGAQVRVVARAQHLAESSVRRHLRNHLSPELRQQAAQGRQLRASTMIGRLVELSDDVAMIRAQALESGTPRTALAAVDSERAVLNVLVDRFGITDVSVADELHEAATFTTALAEALAVAPEFSVPLAASLRARNASAFALAVEHRAAPYLAAAAATASPRAVLQGAPPAPTDQHEGLNT